MKDVYDIMDLSSAVEEKIKREKKINEIKAKMTR